jgi:nucleoside-diphosphate-sugar epimerase
MGNLRVLFIGGSGTISSACSRVAADSGIELFVLNRGRSTSRPLPPGVTMLRGDIREPQSVRDEIKDLEFDAVTVDQHPQRLAREAVFLLVFGSRPGIKSALLRRLGASAA